MKEIKDLRYTLDYSHDRILISSFVCRILSKDFNSIVQGLSVDPCNRWFKKSYAPYLF